MVERLFHQLLVGELREHREYHRDKRYRQRPEPEREDSQMSAGARAMHTSSIIDRVVSSVRTCGDGETIRNSREARMTASRVVQSLSQGLCFPVPFSPAPLFLPALRTACPVCCAGRRFPSRVPPSGFRFPYCPAFFRSAFRPCFRTSGLFMSFYRPFAQFVRLCESSGSGAFSVVYLTLRRAYILHDRNVSRAAVGAAAALDAAREFVELLRHFELSFAREHRGKPSA